jgi:hypothetical protein
VGPPKLIAVEELPPGVGLLWAAGDSRLITKRRAVRHEIDTEATVSLMAYTLMSRSRIVGDMWEAQRQPNVDLCREWLLERNGSRAIGHMVSRRLAEQLRAAERARQQAEGNAKRYEHIEQRIVELGLDPSAGITAGDLEAKFGRPRASEQLRRIERMAQEIARAASMDAS